MGTLIAQPKTQKQLSAVKAVWKALDISFRQQKESPCNEAFAVKMKRGEKAADEVRDWKSADLLFAFSNKAAPLLLQVSETKHNA